MSLAEGPANLETRDRRESIELAQSRSVSVTEVGLQAGPCGEEHFHFLSVQLTGVQVPQQ